MSDLISRQAAIDTLDVGAELLRRVLDDNDIVGAEREKYEWGLGLIESYISDMKELPSAQPEIIRCKDCRYIDERHYEDEGEPPYIKYTCANKAGLAKGYQVHEWDFCSRAARKDEQWMI